MLEKDRLDMPQGTPDLLILRTLSVEPQHGWAVAERIRQVSRQVLEVRQGSLYPALHRLERRGWGSSPPPDVSSAPTRIAYPGETRWQ